MNQKLRIIVIGVLRTWLVCLIVALVMYYLGHWEEDGWLIWVSAVALPFYYVYGAYRKPRNVNNQLMDEKSSSHP